ncbi:MAG: RNA-binding transcriptional accessory protein, partial [Bacteroidales bacterium]|nr:RNA-binding transcriptional accessory protein [Bacteroidales bacterium]
MSHISKISKKLAINEWQVENVIRLLDSGATIPFISRYRKEMTGSLDEVQIGQIKEEYERLQELDARREAIIKSIEEQEKMTPELKERLNVAQTMSELEDIYLPYRPKRRTRAAIAREKGLEPLADVVFQQYERDPELVAEKYLSDDVPTVDEALLGAKDIIAEKINEEEEARKRIRHQFEKEAMISSKVIKGKEEEGAKFKDYF